MKPRRLYYRRKDKSIVIEGKNKDGSSVLIWTLPEPEKLISQLIGKASYFTKEKADKILEKIGRLDYKSESNENTPQEVHTTITMRSQEKDADTEEIIEADDDIFEEIKKNEIAN